MIRKVSEDKFMLESFESKHGSKNPWNKQLHGKKALSSNLKIVSGQSRIMRPDSMIQHKYSQSSYQPRKLEPIDREKMA